MKARLFSSSRAGALLAAAAVGVALMACGTIAARSDTTPVPPDLRATSRGCEATELRALVDTSAVKHTSDGTYLPIDLINKWREECKLSGYVAVTGVADSGQDAHAVHIRAAVTPVTLGENYAAHIWVLIAKAPGGADCRQLTAKGLRATLPGGKGHDWIQYPFTACAGAGQALLSIRPVLQGLANPTSFP